MRRSQNFEACASNAIDSGTDSADDSSVSSVSLDNIPIPKEHDTQSQRFHWCEKKLDNGLKYQGSLSATMKRDGVGKIKTARGYFVGEWQNDQRHGLGCEKVAGTDFHEEIRYGKWQSNVLQQGYVEIPIEFDESRPAPPEELTCQSVVYKGTIVDGKYQGLGQLILEPMHERSIRLVADWEEGEVKQILSNDIQEKINLEFDKLFKSISINNDQSISAADRYWFLKNLRTHYSTRDKDRDEQCFKKLPDEIDSRIKEPFKKILYYQKLLTWCQCFFGKPVKLEDNGILPKCYKRLVKAKSTICCEQRKYYDEMSKQGNGKQSTYFKKCTQLIANEIIDVDHADEDKSMAYPPEMIKFYLTWLNKIPTKTKQLAQKFKEYQKGHGHLQSTGGSSAILYNSESDLIGYFIKIWKKHWEQYCHYITTIREPALISQNDFMTCYLTVFDWLYEAITLLAENYGAFIEFSGSLNSSLSLEVKGIQIDHPDDNSKKVYLCGESIGPRMEKAIKRFNQLVHFCVDFTDRVPDETNGDAVAKWFDTQMRKFQKVSNKIALMPKTIQQVWCQMAYIPDDHEPTVTQLKLLSLYCDKVSSGAYPVSEYKQSLLLLQKFNEKYQKDWQSNYKNAAAQCLAKKSYGVDNFNTFFDDCEKAYAQLKDLKHTSPSLSK